MDNFQWKNLPFYRLPFLPVFFDRFYRFTGKNIFTALPFLLFTVLLKT